MSFVRRDFSEVILWLVTCMDTHMALQKLTMTKVMIVSHCSLVNAAIVANSRPV